MKTKKSSEFGVRSSELNSTIRNPQSAIVSAGFTLLEVIISMAIIATALV
ncbi:MAG: prepilin-type N-terminal cleavage/methylation domain-containing protein, partial [Deltaproteobacteria bacterium]|nr:prepilin-type N-terminal cleavage/methylation domain-containing protein [Deltaproteobacteria bacterium]